MGRGKSGFDYLKGRAMNKIAWKTRDKLRKMYFVTWGSEWPHDNDYLDAIYRRVREVHKVPRRDQWNDIWYATLIAMRECS
jgi:hypothetical protein